MYARAKRILLPPAALAVLWVAAGNAALAQDAHLLQQRASFAYREMQLAEREAEQAAIEAKNIDARIVELQTELEASRKRSATAHANAKAATERAREARKRWEAASDALEKAPPEAKPQIQ